MKIQEIQEYIKNWSDHLIKNGIKGLTEVLKDYEYFDFEPEHTLGNESEYVHAYLGASKDLSNIKVFIISDVCDRKEKESQILKHISIVNLKKYSNNESLKEIIDNRRAKKRINRWKKNPNYYLAEEHNLVRCFKIPVEDLFTDNNRVYFAIKKARTIKQKDYRIDLIIKNIGSEMKEVEMSYDTIRLVPPFPPTTKSFFLLDIEH